MQHLNINTVLQGGKYKIISVLGQGGFGITYLAENTMLDGKVAIKEFFFKEYCNRDEATSHMTIPTDGNREIVNRFKQKFIKEARTIFKLTHNNIIRILDVFEENSTAYYVMEYIEGESLGDIVKQRGFIPEQEALEYIKEVGKALTYIHSKSINHLDIKPSNIMKRKEDGKILVIDFGVAKQYDMVTSEGTTTTPVGISHGYSPSEQYLKNGVQSFSPQSDVYALAATLFKLLTGVTPPEAVEVREDGLPLKELESKNISSTVISAIVMAMKGKHERTQSVEAFIRNLSDDEKTKLSDEAKKQEEERKLKDAEAKAQAEAKAKVEAESKAAAEKKAREEAERKRLEAENALRKERQSNNKKIWIWIVVALIIGAAAFAIYKNTSTPKVIPITEVENQTIVLPEGKCHESKRHFTYTGEIDSVGLPNGQGKAQYPETKATESSTFEGTFVHGITNNGVMTFKNGTKFEGTFTEDGWYNEGTWWEADGYYFKGSFKNGDPYNGTWYTPKNQVDSKVVNGKYQY